MTLAINKWVKLPVSPYTRVWRQKCVNARSWNDVSPTSNLSSVYGSMDARHSVSRQHNLKKIVWAETGQSSLRYTPWEDPQKYIRNSPVFFADKVKTPIMLIHGDIDFVPIAQSEEMFTALARLERDALFVRYWGEGHVITSPANIRDYWQRIFKWFDRKFED